MMLFPIGFVGLLFGIYQIYWLSGIRLDVGAGQEKFTIELDKCNEGNDARVRELVEYEDTLRSANAELR